MDVTIEDIADLIRRMTADQRAELADALTKPRPGRCNTKVLADRGEGGPCIREKGHPIPHVDAAGNDSMIAMRCRIGVVKGEMPVCSELDGHDPPCVPIERPPAHLAHVGQLPRVRARAGANLPPPVALHDVPDFEPQPPGLRHPDARDLRRSSAGGHTYFAQAVSGGPIKIGFTRRDPAVRVAELGGAEEMVVLATIRGNVEKATHLALDAHRLRREWFSPAPEVLAVVEQARSVQGHATAPMCRAP